MLIPVGIVINVADSAAYGGGSAYNKDAPCNADWVRAHPFAAARIRSINYYGLKPLMIFAVLLVALSFFTLPAVTVIYFIMRVVLDWHVRRRYAMLAYALFLVAMLYPEYQCALCVLD